MKRNKLSRTLLCSVYVSAFLIGFEASAEGLKIQAFPENFEAADKANEKAKEKFDPSQIEPASGEVQLSQSADGLSGLQNLFSGNKNVKPKRVPKSQLPQRSNEKTGNDAPKSETVEAEESSSGGLELPEDPFLLEADEEENESVSNRGIEIQPQTNMPYPEEDNPTNTGPGEPISPDNMVISPGNEKIVIDSEDDVIQPRVIETPVDMKQPSKQEMRAPIVPQEEPSSLLEPANPDDLGEQLQGKTIPKKTQPERPMPTETRSNRDKSPADSEVEGGLNFEPDVPNGTQTQTEERTDKVPQTLPSAEAPEKTDEKGKEVTEKTPEPEQKVVPKPLLNNQAQATNNLASQPPVNKVQQQTAPVMPSQTSLRTVAPASQQPAKKPPGKRLQISPSPYSYAVPTNIKQSPRMQEQAQVLGRAMRNNWQAYQGSNLREVLNDWARQSGVRLLWVTDNDFAVIQNVIVEGSFEQAVQGVLEQFDGQGTRPVGRLHIDPNSQERTLIIQTLYEG